MKHGVSFDSKRDMGIYAQNLKLRFGPSRAFVRRALFPGSRREAAVCRALKPKKCVGELRNTFVRLRIVNLNAIESSSTERTREMPILGPTTNHEEIRLWAEGHKAVPTEALPHLVDHEPSMVRMFLPNGLPLGENVRVITWEEFFLIFDELGLTFVYEDDSTNNELLQIETLSPYLNPRYRPMNLMN